MFSRALRRVCSVSRSWCSLSEEAVAAASAIPATPAARPFATKPSAPPPAPTGPSPPSPSLTRRNTAINRRGKSVHSHIKFAPPTDEELALLRRRLAMPYRLPAGVDPRLHMLRASPLLPPRRLLCLDVGNRYIGVSLSDRDNTVAVPLTTVYRKEDVALKSTPSRPISPHSHHIDTTTVRKHFDLRTRSAGKVVQRPIALVHAEVRDLLLEYECVGLVVGMPLTLKYRMDVQCTHTIDFVQGLQKYLIAAASESTPATLGRRFILPALFWWDERFSSADAKQQLSARGFSGRQLAVQTDSVASASILQGFLDRMNLKLA